MSGTNKSGRRMRFRSLGAVIGVAVVAATIGMTAEHASADELLSVDTEIEPATITQGGIAVATTELYNNDYYGTLEDVIVYFNTSWETPFDLKATKALGGLSSDCRYGTGEGGGIVTSAMSCPIGDLASDYSELVSSPAVVRVVLTTTDVIETPYEGYLYTDAYFNGEGVSWDYDSFDVIASNPDSVSTFVPPGKTLAIGPKQPNETDPVVGVFKLPKVKGSPGAAVTLEQLAPGEDPILCGGRPCDGLVIRLSDFPGYNDPKKPATLTISWYGPTLNGDDDTTTLYGAKDDNIAFAIPTCIKVAKAYTNTPCLAKHKFKKKTGMVTDTIALLSGDPKIGRR